ncbi:MAG: DUF4105 domain-containing protein [Burkholderiales bacterium]|nr:DUF4105 domain-containing protein [Burkholderiales bacterium]
MNPFRMQALLRGLTLAALGCLAFSLYAAELTPQQQHYLSSLQQRAHAAGLARQDAWRALLHYKVQPLTRTDRSLADDPDFFNAPDGSHNPEAELNATLAAFFDPTSNRALNQTASCRFIARFQWLNEQLHFDPQLLPAPSCTRYTQWRQGLNAASATLVFPAAYLNSPASMYGHTFLRLDPPRQPGTPYSPLLSYAINYAANGNEAEGLAFAFKGLMGLYPGQFTNSPYYLRIRDYNDLENRDIWEYDLNLTPTEIDRMLAHAWELGPTRFDYFFFDENCSYHLLALLDAARPGLDLTDQFTWWAIPIDTVRAVTRTPGLLKAVHYRPSNSTELRYRAEQIGPQRTAVAKRLALGQITPEQLDQTEPDPTLRANMYEVAERYLAYDATQRSLGEAFVQQQRMRFLGARARLPSGTPVVVPTPSTAPQDGHGTARIDVALGRRDGQSIIQINARPAYHDLLDPEAGFQRGSAIQFFRVELAKQENGSVQLEKLTPVDIVSLSPYDGLMSARSWRVRFGLTRSWARIGANDPSRRQLAFEINGGPGAAAELLPGQRLLGYAFLDNQLWLDPALPEQKFAAGSGIAVGALWDPLPQWRIQAEMYGRASLDHQPRESGARLDQRWQLNERRNAVLQCTWRRRDHQAMQHECLAGIQQYW